MLVFKEFCKKITNLLLPVNKTRIFYKQRSAPKQVWKMKRVNISITKSIKLCKNLKEEKYEEKCRRGKWSKEEYLSTWIANKRKIFKAHESGQVNSSRKKLKKSDYKDLDEAVFTCFKNARSNNIPVTEMIIKETLLLRKHIFRQILKSSLELLKHSLML